MRQDIRNRLVLAAALVAASISACGRDEGRAPAAGEGQRAVEPVRIGGFALTEGVLYRARGDVLEPVAALPGAGAASDTLTVCAVSPELGAIRFRELKLSPDSTRAVWGTLGPGSCVGVIGPGEPPVRVLGRWSAATPDSLLWAPSSRHVAIWLRHPSERRSLEVYDAVEARRLEMPWEVDCEYVEDCDVIRVAWLGGTLLNVEIRLGPAELSVPFEVNVEAGRGSGAPEKEI